MPGRVAAPALTGAVGALGRSLSSLLVFVGKRLLQLIPVLLGVIALTFFFSHISVRNPCAAWLGGHARQSAIDACVQYFGLNHPLYVQFWDYLTQLFTGNWGTSVQGLPVLPTVLAAFPQTLELVFAALFLMIVIGIPLGVVAANSNGRLADHFVRIFYLSGWATPTYLGALLLAIGVGPLLGLPTSGDFTGSPNIPQPTHISVLDALLAGNVPLVGDAISHLILPATALAFLNMGIATRMTRASMLEVLPLDYVKTARMKGLSEFFVLYKHALRNSLITTTTVLGITAGALLSGTVVIEEIFQWPGIGRLAFDSITNYDFALTIGTVIVFAVGVVVSNLVADVLYGVLDPRVEWR
ncbi:MAG: ABC transporter permease [Thermoplasmata archaeon]|nr:ABC transporter permease [Thermoplasmata archaeon]